MSSLDGTMHHRFTVADLHFLFYIGIARFLKRWKLILNRKLSSNRSVSGFLIGYLIWLGGHWRRLRAEWVFFHVPECLRKHVSLPANFSAFSNLGQKKKAFPSLLRKLHFHWTLHPTRNNILESPTASHQCGLLSDQSFSDKHGAVPSQAKINFWFKLLKTFV